MRKSIYDNLPLPAFSLPMNDNAAATAVKDITDSYSGVAQQNTDQISVAGLFQRALSFNGSSDYVDMEETFNSIFGADFTVNVWVQLADGASGCICGTDNADDDKLTFLMGETAGLLTFQTSLGQEILKIANLSLENSKWGMLTIVLKQEDNTYIAEVYQDGELKVSESAVGFLSGWSSALDFVWGGKMTGGGVGSFLECRLMSAMMFDTALSAAQVKMFYDRFGKQSVYGSRPNKIYENNIRLTVAG